MWGHVKDKFLSKSKMGNLVTRIAHSKLLVSLSRDHHAVPAKRARDAIQTRDCL
jgi:hypothetical protein